MLWDGCGAKLQVTGLWGGEGTSISIPCGFRDGTKKNLSCNEVGTGQQVGMLGEGR